MTVILEIKDNKADFIMELLKNFPFVKAKPVNPEKERILNDLKESIEEVKLHKQGKIKMKSFYEFLNEL